MNRTSLSKKSLWLLSIFVVAGSLLLAGGPGGTVMAQVDVVQEYSTDSGVDYPVMGEPEYFTESQYSSAQRGQCYLRVLELREKIASQYIEEMGSDAEVSGDTPDVSETDLADESEAPGDFNILNRLQPLAANPAYGVSPPLAEPAMANQGKYAMYLGNTFASYTLNQGNSWTNIPIEAGPTDAPYVCCDPDVIYHKPTNTIFRIFLYVNNPFAPTDGMVRVWVHRKANLPAACYYDIRPRPGNMLPDYPHLGASNDFLYLTTNNIGSDPWISQVRRWDVDLISRCQAVPFTVFERTGGAQKVFVPVDGAKQTMYWGSIESSNTFRVYWWPESTTTVSSVDRTVASRVYANPDCRGGVGNYDFIERGTAWSDQGFRLRGAIGTSEDDTSWVAFYWNVANDASHPQAYVASAIFRTTDKILISQPDIWNSGVCFGYPAVGSNDRGDLGLSVAAGGRAGGGGTAAQGYVAIDDDFTPGIGFFQTVLLTAAGTHNRSDGRFGDYFTVRPYSPPDLGFIATNYALNGGTSVTNVNSRYIQFVRGHNVNGFVQWRGHAPLP